MPSTELPMLIMSTEFKEILPVTVGRCCVRFIFRSKSTSYQLFNINAPAITRVPPTVINKNLSQKSKKDASVKYKASQNPLNIGKIFAIRTNPFTNNFKSAKKPLILCFSMSHSVVINVLHLFIRKYTICPNHYNMGFQFILFIDITYLVHF